MYVHIHIFQHTGKFILKVSLTYKYVPEKLIQILLICISCAYIKINTKKLFFKHPKWLDLFFIDFFFEKSVVLFTIVKFIFLIMQLTTYVFRNFVLFTYFLFCSLFKFDSIHQQLQETCNMMWCGHIPRNSCTEPVLIVYEVPLLLLSYAFIINDYIKF